VLPTLYGTAIFLALMAGTFVPLEAWCPHARGSASRRAIASGVGLLFAGVIAMELAGGAVLDAVAAWRGPVAEPGGLRLLAVFALAELGGYWIHRAMHRVPGLWRFHRLHHEPRVVRWIDAWRQHPVDLVIHGVVVGLPGALLGASLSEVAAVVLLRKSYTTWLHANVSWRLEWLVPWLATPAFHRRHHGHDPRDYDRNFAGMFPALDRLFGTHAGE
jgi:sterol desaturase/sphingolipid hydroxylase (fatty acid hydroxylase superfamily)